MNIEKLAKHLKEFTLDEIEMIAECDCTTGLKQLLNANKIRIEQGIYKYNKAEKIDFGIFIENNNKTKDMTIDNAVQYFLKNYVKKYCSKKTYRLYKTTFKLDILPILDKNKITEFNKECIVLLFNTLVDRNFKAFRIKNTMALLKQFLKYCTEEKLMKCYSNFQVKRITKRNEYNLNRIIFGKNYK